VTTKPAVASVDSDILNSRLSILNSRPVNYTQLFVQSSSKLIHPSSCTGWDIHIRNYSTDKDQSNDPGSKTDKDQSKDPDSKKDEPKKNKKAQRDFWLEASYFNISIFWNRGHSFKNCKKRTGKKKTRQ